MARPAYFFALLSLTLLMVVGLELGLRAMFFVRDGGLTGNEDLTDVDDRALLPAYADADFDPVLVWEEIRLGTEVWLSYAPYTVWTRRPIEGRYVNVGADGHRATTGNAADAPDPLRVWMFGGSTTWGIGVPDAYTIPSQLARRLVAAGIPATVINFGQTGFVSTQDHLELFRALQTRAAPDLVIMYEGANEPLGLLDTPDRVNPHYLLDRIAALFEGEASSPPPALALLQDSAMYRFARGLNARLFGNPREAAATPVYPTDPGEIEALARRELAAYLTSQQAARALATDFGFRLFSFWQPRLGVGAKPLHESEQVLLEELSAAPDQRFMLGFSRAQLDALRRRLEQSDVPALYDLSNVFADTSEPVFVDWVHISHAGNARVADAMVEHIRAVICGAAPAEGAQPDQRLRALCAG